MALTPKPALLAKRLELARQRLSTTAKVDLAAATRPAHAPPPLPPPANPTRKNAAQKTAKPPAPEPAPKAGKAKGKGRATNGAADGATEPDLATRLRQMAENPAALAFVTDAQLVEIFTAMVSNAANKGSTGAMDRQALFRAAGLPFQGGIGARGGKGGKTAGPEIAGRLETALNRSRSRVPVTDDAATDEIPMETAA